MRRYLAEWLLYGLLAIAGTYPVITVVGTHLPLGVEPSPTVPLLNLWTIWWNVDRLEHGYQGYWDAPLYYPTRGALALTEPQSVMGPLAWPLWQFAPRPEFVYNCLLLIFLTLNGWVGCRLLTQYHIARPAALAGGAMISLLPLIHWQLGVLQAVSVWGVLWTLLALERLRRAAGPWTAVHVAVAFVCTYSLCCYYGLFLALLLSISLPLMFGRRLRQHRVWLWGSVALVTAGLLLTPIVTSQVSVARREAITFPRTWIDRLSAWPEDYLRTPAAQRIAPSHRSDPQRSYPWPLSPGTLKYGLAAIGVVFALRMRRHRRPALLCLLLSAAAMMLSMGPHLAGCGAVPYETLVRIVPGLAQARNLYRCAIFVQIAVVILATFGVHGLYRQLRRVTPTNRRANAIAMLTVFMLGAIMAGQTWPPRPAIYATESAVRSSRWVHWLRQPEQAQVRLAFFPLPSGRQAADHILTTQWMYSQIWHARPMINGYTTWLPRELARVDAELRTFPSASAVTALQQLGITHCVLFRDERIITNALAAGGMRHVLDDAAANVQIWELPAAPRSPEIIERDAGVRPAKGEIPDDEGNDGFPSAD